MFNPTGSDQTLSLAWALKWVAGRSPQEAAEAVCGLFGIAPARWEEVAYDKDWYVGDLKRHSKSQSEITNVWNLKYAAGTGVWLDEEAWLTPLWGQWLPTGKMIFAANLRYLLELRGWGTVNRLARALGKSRTTASKWGNWQQEGKRVRVPPKTDLPKIQDFFGLKATVDLYSNPLFLGRDELEDEMLRATGKHYLDSLRGEYLRQAVVRIREESDLQRLKNEPSD